MQCKARSIAYSGDGVHPALRERGERGNFARPKASLPRLSFRDSFNVQDEPEAIQSSFDVLKEKGGLERVGGMGI